MKRLTTENIAAATTIIQFLPFWVDADLGLEQLRKHFPSNTTLSDVLVKSSAIDKLYSTRAGNVYWVADAVVAAMEDAAKPRSDGKPYTAVDIVDLVSDHKCKQHKNKKAKRCPSFASKYCYFFVDDWDFPIYDSFALAAVKDLLGTQRGLTPGRSEYGDFFERIKTLRARDGLDGVELRKLDRFLWLWGQWLFKDKPPGINEYVYDVFQSEKPDVQRLLQALQPRDK